MMLVVIAKNAIIVGKQHKIFDGEQNAIFGEYQKVHSSSINNLLTGMSNRINAVT